MSIKNNTALLNSLLEQVNNLPEATGGVEDLTAELSAQATLIAEQDEKIAELGEILSGKAGSSGGETGSQFFTVRIYLKDTKLSDYYLDHDDIYHNVPIYCTYIGQNFEKKRSVSIFENNMTNMFDKNEVYLTVLTGSSILLYLHEADNHFVDNISSKHNELYDLNLYKKNKLELEDIGGHFESYLGYTQTLIPIYGDTEIRLTE